MQIKRSLLSFIIINIVYLVYFFLLMIWLKQPVIGFGQGAPVQLAANVIVIIQVIMSLLSLLIFSGLIYLLAAFKEAWYIRLSLIVYTLSQLYYNLTSLTATQLYTGNWFNIQIYLTYAILIWMVISLYFVKEKTVRSYYRWFGICVLLSIVLARVLPYLYENYGLMRYQINPGIIKLPSFVVSLTLFLKVYGSQPKTKRL